ncbi:Chaperone SurA [Carnimonas sp. R-84981]|uniref:peptidylprolyl isomerase n=1 Tax=Carnimonas bestiolae TaxID=3402172 RepID=UPI003EDC0E69
MKNGNKAAGLRLPVSTRAMLLPLGVVISLGATAPVFAQQTSANQPSGGAAPEQKLEGIAAVVNKDVIMTSELQARMAQIRQQISSEGGQLPPQDVLQRQVLDRLILEHIQLQLAKRANLSVSDQQLDQAVAEVASRNHMSSDQFVKTLQRQGLSYNQVRQQIRREILISQVQQGSVGGQVRVSDQEVNQFLENQAAATGVQYHVAQLLIPLPDEATDAQVRAAQQRASKLRNSVLNGESFEQAAASANPTDGDSDQQSTSQVESADLGWRSQQDLPTLFSSVVPNLTVGTVSQPVRSASGIHLVRLIDRRGGQQAPVKVEQFKARHILISPNPIRTDAQAHQLAQELRQKIEGGADFGELAKQYSDDHGSALSGGQMDWVNDGDTVGPFNDYLHRGAIGQLSQPIKTQFGWHIIEVQERRQKDVTVDQQREQARRALFQRKAQDELQTWLQQIRSEAYVDNRLYPNDKGIGPMAPMGGGGQQQPQ